MSRRRPPENGNPRGHIEMIHISRTAIFLFVLCRLFDSIPAAAQQEHPLRMNGYTILTDEKLPDEFAAYLRAVAEPYPPGDGDSDRFSSHLISLFMNEGYLAASAASEIRGDTIRISAGGRSVIRSVTAYPDTIPLSGEVNSMNGELTGEYVSTRRIESWIAELLVRFEDAGYPFTTIGLDSMRIESSERPEVDLFFSFRNFDPVPLHTIRIEGNVETRERLIMRQAGIFPGDLYSKRAVEGIKPRLMRTGLFRSIGEPKLSIDRNGGRLLITLEESPFNSFDGMLGYVPEPAGGGFFTGLAHVTMRNLFGTMRRFEARWQRESRLTQELSFGYREPYLAGFPLSVSLGFRQRQQDSTYVQTKTRLTADTELLNTITVGVSYEYETVIPADDIPQTRVRDSRSHFGGFEISYDTRTDAVVPRGGILYSTGYQTGEVRRGSGEAAVRETVRKFYIDLHSYIPVGLRNIFYLGLHGREVRMNDVQESDLFRVGGTRTLRGYREGQFLGTRLAWSNLEYRYMTGRRSYVFAFMDTGYYSLPLSGEQGADRDEFLYGYGAGLQIETGIGLISVGFGFGRGDTFGTGKLHIGVINEF